MLHIHHVTNITYILLIFTCIRTRKSHLICSKNLQQNLGSFDKYRYFKNIDIRYSPIIQQLLFSLVKFRQRVYGGNCEFRIQVRGQFKLKAELEMTDKPLNL